VALAGSVAMLTGSILWSAPAAVAVPGAQKSVLHVLVVGDSYSAGNGAGEYYGARGCYRSHRDYAQLFANSVRSAPFHQPTVVTNVACSGAVTADFFHGKKGRPPEIDAVTKNDTLIFLTIGGNDAYFADIVQYCLVAKFRNGDHCNKNLSRAERLATDGTIKSRILGVLRAIRRRANPGARIVLLGYPYLEGDQSYTLRSGHGDHAPLIYVGRRLHALGNDADRIDASLVAQLDRQYPDQFVFVSVHKLFDGPPYHGLYAKKNNPHRWMIQPFVDAGLAENSIWYHPDPTGWKQESKLLVSDLAVPKEVPPEIVTTALPSATAGVPYSAVLTTADHRAGSWAVTSGALPKGLHLHGYVISGTPATVGVTSFGLTFTDRERQVSEAKAKISVLAPPAPPEWGQPAKLHGSGYDQLTGVSCTAATACVAVDHAGYSVSLTKAGWQAPVSVDKGNWLNAVSCATADFCVAVGADGTAATYDGTSWGKPQQVDPNGALISVSCPSVSFCAAASADGTGDVYTFNGSSWSSGTAVVPASSYLDAVSCASASFCVAVGSTENSSQSGQIGQAVVDDAGTWGAPVTIDAQASMGSVSCVTARFCMAVASDTDAISYDGKSWSSPARINTEASEGVVAVACASPDLCVEGDYGGSASYFNGSSWSNPVWAADGINAAACDRGSYCVLVDQGGNAVSYTGGGFSLPVTVDGSVIAAEAVSCASSTYCAVATTSSAGGSGFATLEGGTWLENQTGVYGSGIHTVSCPTSNFCAAAVLGSFYGFGGYPMTANDSRWSRPEAVSGSGLGGGAGQVSCVRSGFCVGVGDSADGGAIEFDGSWKKITSAFPHSDVPYAVSCASPTFCLAVSGDVAGVFNGAKWLAAGMIGASVDYVACPAVGYCVAVGGNASFTYSEGTWSSAGAIGNPGYNLTGFSCAATDYCVAVDSNGDAMFFNGRAWSSTASIDPGQQLTGVSCPTVHYCLAVDESAQIIIGSSKS
jgi:lysophospholipase L1-like esterase